MAPELDILLPVFECIVPVCVCVCVCVCLCVCVCVLAFALLSALCSLCSILGGLPNMAYSWIYF